MSNLTELISKAHDGIAEAAQVNNTDSGEKQTTETEQVSGEKKESTEANGEATTSNTSVTDEAPKKGTAQHKISTLVARNKQALEALNAERHRAAQLEERIAKLEANPPKRSDDDTDDSEVKEGSFATRQEFEEALTLALTEYGKTLEQKNVEQTIGVLNTEFAELLKKEYGKYYDEETDIMDEDVLDEMQSISSIYRSDPKRWLEYSKKNGVSSLARIVKADKVDSAAIKAKAEKVNLSDSDKTSKEKINDKPSKMSLRDSIEKAMSIIKDRGE